MEMMAASNTGNDPKPWFRRMQVVGIYEISVWLIYVCIYKYSYYLDLNEKYLGRPFVPTSERTYFPHPQLVVYAILMTLYVLPFYRLIAPRLLQHKKYFWLFCSVIFYFQFVPKFTNYLVNEAFRRLNQEISLQHFFETEHFLYNRALRHIGGWDLKLLFIDIVAFLSIAFMCFGFESEQKKQRLENDNLVLRLESLKAQLHPHFLFNTLNSIYGMSLAGAPETPDFILRLSDMMRFILYDCQQHKVPLEKDIEFLDNYIRMEKQRYPTANIAFTVTGLEEDGSPEAAGKATRIAPLLLIPFVENAFKHGTHRIAESGLVNCRIHIEKDKLQFMMVNDVLTDTGTKTRYGGVGIANVQRRLDLYYPGKHTLRINNDHRTFTVELTIHLTQ